MSVLSDHDVELFRAGAHARLYRGLGSHACESGTRFAVWAPRAAAVSVIGDFNGWQPAADPLTPREDGSGIWEATVAAAAPGTLYKYHIQGQHGGAVDRGDPWAFTWEQAPGTASRVWTLDYEWNDAEWMASRGRRQCLDCPLAIYQLHLESWRRVLEPHGNRPLTYREAAHALLDHLRETAFTHVQLMPVMEHSDAPLRSDTASNDTIGYFAPSSRYGSPQDCMYLVDLLHQHGYGVFLEWVPTRFPVVAQGLAEYDGSPLYEDPRFRWTYPESTVVMFDWSRPEVRSFLLSSALFWLEQYHADGLHIGGLGPALYRGQELGEEHFEGATEHGNRAIEFLCQLNETLYREFPDIHTLTRESSSGPMMSRPTFTGGVGFGLEWHTHWAGETRRYLANPPHDRKYHHAALTAGVAALGGHNFVLPLAHDPVAPGGGSLLGGMPGDDWQRRANLRLLFGYTYGHPGKKLVFMGGEIGQSRPWQRGGSLDWHLLEDPAHLGLRAWVRDLNRFYASQPAMYQCDFSRDGFQWVNYQDAAASVLSFIRYAEDPQDQLLVVCNFTPVVRRNYRVGVPRGGWWHEILNSDGETYGGSGQGNFGGVEAAPVATQGQYRSLLLTLPPLAVLFLRPA
ncbi:1,4-alpha-glucan branching protein GlgB [Candidatus Laterigemmans baculatus]|uniref:1,4-alpha-glucan branching protein GlgB n=1 Tax=Candidatus Laterigemmans baculatus TaxID=2770505 RepID=UPI00193AF9CC|nr:1,4-alpha-glucan branching protein GlgB [Candidatus Laterigemmans baculatus]